MTPAANPGALPERFAMFASGLVAVSRPYIGGDERVEIMKEISKMMVSGTAKNVIW